MGEVPGLVEALRSETGLDVEERVSLLAKLGDLGELEAENLALVVECLPTLWNDSDCTGMPQCQFKKHVLSLATKCLGLKSSCCISHFIILGTKASMWCRKQLEVTMASLIELQQDQNFNLFFQQLFDVLSFSSSIILTLTRSPLFGDKVVLLIVENFILEQMNLIKVLLMDIKKIHSIAAATLKLVPAFLDAVVKLSRAYYETVNQDSVKSKDSNVQDSLDSYKFDCYSHAMHINTSALQGFYELGTIAASGGGNLVAVLNASWKGLVTLLQLNKKVLNKKINVGDIVFTIVSLAIDSLRCVVDAWLHTFKDSLALHEAKRALLPVKFYLINAVRISSEYPFQASNAFAGISKCVLMISTFVVLFSKRDHLRAASEALAEVLEPTSFLLLCSIVNSADVIHECKLQILKNIFTDENISKNVSLEQKLDDSKLLAISEHQISGFEDFVQNETLVTGQVMVFLSLLKNSVLLSEELVLGISRRLGCLLNCLKDENVYSWALDSQVPTSSTSITTNGVCWEPVLPYLLHCLRTFMIVASSSDMAWVEVESFLLQNLFHPHVICHQIVLELWCFMSRHAEPAMLHGAFDRLCSLWKAVAESEPSLAPFSALRKMSRSIATIVSSAPQATMDRVYDAVLLDDNSVSSVMQIAILMEGYPLDALSYSLRNHSFQMVLSAFFGILEDNQESIKLMGTSVFDSSAASLLPVQTLAYALHCCQISSHDVFDNERISQLLKFTTSVINIYLISTESLKQDWSALLGAMLDIIANLKLYATVEVQDIILALHKLFVSSYITPEAALQCKVWLASFMAGLCQMNLEESDANCVCSAVWDLYHMLLKERHWAFIHLALTAFGYFTARTSCTQLWRFVPGDAALSFDMDTGKEANEERFMEDFKVFLEKELALKDVTPCKKQHELLLKEGALLREKLGKISDITADGQGTEPMEIMEEKQTTSKKRKLPGGINEGLALLQNGLKVLNDALSFTDDGQVKEELSTQLSCLEDVISHMFNLSNGV